MIAIIDYGVGNLRSVEKAFHAIGADAILTKEIALIQSADAVVLPGVGAFEDGMDNLWDTGLVDVVKTVIKRGTPFLGICLGMQMLLEIGDESNEAIATKMDEKEIPGLGILKGRVKRFPESEGLKVPQMGWNTVSYVEGSRLFAGIPQDQFFYFVHSYYCDLSNVSEVSGVTEYGVTYHSALERENLFATQFHPEKSGELGLQMLRNFVAIVEEKSC
ncbi:MAG: imidazole glycerol phosphate synthase subunit HisH [Clostridia bacterium]